MLVVIGVDILTRSLFNFSFEISDELGGYMLVVISLRQPAGMPDQRQLSPRRAGAVSPLAVRPRGVPRHIRCSLARFLRAAVVAIDAIRAFLVPLRRSCPDLSGDAAVDTAKRDDARRGGAVLLDARTLAADVTRLRTLGKTTEGAGEP